MFIHKIDLTFDVFKQIQLFIFNDCVRICYCICLKIFYAKKSYISGSVRKYLFLDYFSTLYYMFARFIFSM